MPTQQGAPAAAPAVAVPGSVPAAMPTQQGAVAAPAATDRPLQGLSALPKRGAVQGPVTPGQATSPSDIQPAAATMPPAAPTNGSTTKDGKEPERWRLFKRLR
jgi:hypothetical protein